MTIFSHLLSIISYGVLATIFALVLPTMVPDVGVTTGYIAGGGFFLALVLLHEIISRRRQSGDIDETIRQAWSAHAIDIEALRSGQKELVGELTEARRTIDELEERVEHGAGHAMIAEMRVLQDQLGQLAGVRGGARQAGMTARAAGAAVGGGGRTPLRVVPTAPAESSGDILDTIRSALGDNRIDL